MALQDDAKRLETILEKLSNSSESIRLKAVGSLEPFSLDNQKILLKAFDDTSLLVRREATKTLRRLYTSSGEHFDVMLFELGNKHSDVRRGILNIYKYEILNIIETVKMLENENDILKSLVTDHVLTKISQLEAAVPVLSFIVQRDECDEVRDHAWAILSAMQDHAIVSSDRKNIFDIINNHVNVRNTLVEFNENDSRVAFKEKIRELFAALPDDFNGRLAELSRISHAFRLVIAERLSPFLNETIQSMPQNTLDQKKAICDFVEKTLEPLGLAVKMPKTPGLPCKLKTHSGGRPGKGRFMFDGQVDGKRKQVHSDTLPLLELTDVNSSRSNDVQVSTETETVWQNTVGPKSSRTGWEITD